MGDNSSSRGYGPSNRGYHARLYFDGDSRKFELWYVKFMGHLRLRGLKDIVTREASGAGDVNAAPATPVVADPTNAAAVAAAASAAAAAAAAGTASAAASDAEKNAEVYAELCQYIDDRSLSLIIRDAPDDGRKSLNILKEHYMGKGKPRIVTLWTELCTMKSKINESVTDYLIRAENASSALRNAGETVSDSLLIAMVLKGLPPGYKTFEAVITQRNDVVSFAEFKTSLRGYEETEKARGSRETDEVKINRERPRGGGAGKQRYSNQNSNSDESQQIVCYNCGLSGHKSTTCNKKGKKWCKHCKNATHFTNKCKKQSNNTVANKMDDGDEYSFQFMMRSFDHKPAQNPGSVIGHAYDSDLLKSLKNHGDENPDDYLVDSGATRHCINDDSKFISEDLQFKSHEHSIQLADGTVISGVAEKKGTIELSLRASNGKVVKGTFDNVLYVPSYPQSIFSVKGALDKNSSVLFSNELSYMKTPNGLQFNFEKYPNGLYYLRPVVDKVDPGVSSNGLAIPIRDESRKTVITKPIILNKNISPSC